MNERLSIHLAWSDYYTGWLPSVFYSESERGLYEHWTLQEPRLDAQDCAIMLCSALCSFADWGHGVLAAELATWAYTVDCELAPSGPAVRRFEQEQ